VSNFLLENFEEVKKCFCDLKPKEKMMIYCDLLAFVVPRLRPMSYTAFERLTEAEQLEMSKKLREATIKPTEHSDKK